MSGDQPDNDNAAAPHVPVMLAEVLQALAPQAGEVYVDGTFGAGGYSRAMLAAADCRVLAIDRDPDAIAEGQALVAQSGGRLTLVHDVFSDLERIVREAGIVAVDGVVLDIGVSSMQIDRADRGFSFQTDGPLDMRMSQEGRSAADIVNEGEDWYLAGLLRIWGEESQAGRIARAIVKEREAAPITTTRQLVAIIERVLGPPRGDKKHPATRTFQALRIAVNNELHQLMRGLIAAERVLKPGGRLVVVTFHSEEDRIAKRFLVQRTGKTAGFSRHAPPVAEAAAAPSFRFVNQRPLTPSQEEIDRNPRARSAKLRAAVRTEAPAQAADWGNALDPPTAPGYRRR
ncbi:MAG: 16S rRNA (cytosine(1402)-N(4))-methyltransferase RsmH [Hyphomicrobiaceae bacterium]